MMIICSCLLDLLLPTNPEERRDMLLLRLAFAIPGICFIVASIVYWCYLLYQCWVVIQDGENVETTPGLAVGLNFIPFFDCYWIFVAQLGLAKGMNDYCKKREITVPPVSEGLAILSSLMVSVGWVSSIAGFFLFPDTENRLLSILLTLTISGTAIIIDYFLYYQYAENAEAIQQYKVSKAQQ